MTWELVSKLDDEKLIEIAETQKAMSDFYEEKYSDEYLKESYDKKQGLETHYFEDDNFALHFIIRPYEIKKGYKLQTCAVKYKEKEDPHGAALVLLQQLKKLVGDAPVFATWGNNNPESTMEFYRAVADDQNAKEAGFSYCETDTETVNKFENYFTRWG